MISEDKNIWIAILIVFFGILVSALILFDKDNRLQRNYSDDELYPAAFSDSATAVVEYTPVSYTHLTLPTIYSV